jgi:hypothetical protein
MLDTRKRYDYVYDQEKERGTWQVSTKTREAKVRFGTARFICPMDGAP